MDGNLWSCAVGFLNLNIETTSIYIIFVEGRIFGNQIIPQSSMKVLWTSIPILGGYNMHLSEIRVFLFSYEEALTRNTFPKYCVSSLKY